MIRTARISPSTALSKSLRVSVSLARQQMVYKAIWDEMDGQGGTVHAVDTMQLKAPSEV